MNSQTVLLANIVSRSEALVVRALLEQHGVITHLGGEYHASVEVIPLALGGFRLTVPKSQYVFASQVLRDSYCEKEWIFSYGLRRAVFRLWAMWAIVVFFSFLAVEAVSTETEEGSFGGLAIFFLGAVSFPVNPQGRSDYYLSSSDTEIS